MHLFRRFKAIVARVEVLMGSLKLWTRKVNLCLGLALTVPIPVCMAISIQIVMSLLNFPNKLCQCIVHSVYCVIYCRIIQRSFFVLLDLSRGPKLVSFFDDLFKWASSSLQSGFAWQASKQASTWTKVDSTRVLYKWLILKYSNNSSSFMFVINQLSGEWVIYFTKNLMWS